MRRSRGAMARAPARVVAPSAPTVALGAGDRTSDYALSCCVVSHPFADEQCVDRARMRGTVGIDFGIDLANFPEDGIRLRGDTGSSGR